MFRPENMALEDRVAVLGKALAWGNYHTGREDEPSFTTEEVADALDWVEEAIVTHNMAQTVIKNPDMFFTFDVPGGESMMVGLVGKQEVPEGAISPSPEFLQHAEDVEKEYRRVWRVLIEQRFIYIDDEGVVQTIPIPESE